MLIHLTQGVYITLQSCKRILIRSLARNKNLLTPSKQTFSPPLQKSAVSFTGTSRGSGGGHEADVPVRKGLRIKFTQVLHNIHVYYYTTSKVQTANNL